MIKTNFSISYTIRIIDLDYTGRASHASVLNIFQEVRIGYLANLGGYDELNIGDGCGLIQREANICFRKDMHQGDTLKVDAKITEVRGASFIMSYQVSKEEKLMTEGDTTLLALDYTTRKPRRLPEAFKKAITEFESKSH